MTHNCWGAFARRVMLAGMALVAGASVLSAQSTGKVEGYVKDAQGSPIPNARVLIVGTTFSNVTNAKGYYFINGIPAGNVNIRAAFVGYKPVEYDGLRVLAGQTTEQDFALEQAPQQVSDITVTAAKNVLVPRDAVATKQILDGGVVANLPVDRLTAAFAFQPGVTASVCNSSSPTCSLSLSVRGSRTDEQATYLDGVPITPGTRSLVGTGGELGINVNAFEQASITTGASSSEFGNAQGGIVNVTTKSGGSKFAGNVNWETTALPGAYGSDWNMFSGSFGGPIANNLRFNVSGRIEGAESNNGGYKGWQNPTFTRVKIDTTYRLAKTAGNVRSDSVDVNVYDYAVTQGDCKNFSFINNSTDPGIRDNYGYSCKLNQTAAGVGSTYYMSGRLDYSFGKGSRFALSYNKSGGQSRNNLSDGRTFGNSNWSNVATFNWSQTLSRSSTRAASLDAYLSYQWTNNINSPLTAASEAATRDPTMGFLLKKLDYEFTPQNFPLDSTLIYNILFNRANHRIGLTDKVNTSQYSGQTGYGGGPPDLCGCSAAGGGGANDIGLNYGHENRLVGKANLDAQIDRYNRIKLGGEFTHYDIANYTGGTAGTNTILVKPIRYDFFAEDRLDLGDVVLVGGLRYDYYWSKAWRWRDFPRISTRPGFNPDSLYCAVGSTKADNANSICALVQDPSHNYLSPHIQVSFPVTDKTNFRLSYAHQVQAPDFGLMLRQSTSDIDVGGVNSRSSWGSDLDFGKTIQFEFGARHAFSDDMVLDVAVYNKDNLADPAIKFAFPIDPLNGQPTRIYTAQNTDFGNARGIDVTLLRRIGQYFNGQFGYSFIDVKNTGTDAFSYINFFESIVGANAEPPLAALPVSNSRPHTLTGQFNLSLPADWKQGTLAGKILHKTQIFATARISSGTPYTRCNPQDASSYGVRSGGSCGNLDAVTGYNGARLPMYKQFDMRFTRDFRIGHFDMTGYLDARNILNLKNITSVWATTGTTSNGNYAAQLWTTDSNSFRTFGSQSGTLQSDGSLKLPNTKAGCGAMRNGTNPLGAQCFYYIQSEARFGNGDHVYSLAEQKAVSDLNRNINTFDERNFVTGGRALRFGLEVNF